MPFIALGQDCLHAAVGEFGLARQRLRLSAHGDRRVPVAIDVGAHLGKPRLGVEAWRQFGERRGRALVRGIGLREIGIEAAVRFRQRRVSRRMAVDLAFGRSMALARGVGLVLCGAPGVARGGLGRSCGLQFGLGGFQRLTLGGSVVARLLQLVFDIDQARPLGETPCRAGRRVRGRHKTVPAPDVAFRRHQPLAGL